MLASQRAIIGAREVKHMDRVPVKLFLMARTVQALEANCKASGLSQSEVVDRFLLHYHAKDPDIALELIMDELGMVTSAMSKEGLAQVFVGLVGLLGETLLAAGIGPPEVQDIMERLGYIE